jgi:hypothetical protein
MAARTAREIRAAVRAKAQEELKKREDAAIAVAGVLEKRAAVLEQLAAVEREAKDLILIAQERLPLPDLAELTGVNVADLRRLARSGGETPPSDPGGGGRAPAGESATSSAAAVATDAAGTDGPPQPAGAVAEPAGAATGG